MLSNNVLGVTLTESTHTTKESTNANTQLSLSRTHMKRQNARYNGSWVLLYIV